MSDGNGNGAHPPSLLVQAPERGARWTARVGDLSDLFNPDDAAAVRRAARNLGVEEAALRAAVRSARQPEVVLDPRRAFRVVREGPADEELPVRPSLLVPATLGARRVEWEGVELLACATLELRRGARPRLAEELLDAAGADVGWVAAGAVHLLYAAEEGIPANEKALGDLAAATLAAHPGVGRVGVDRSLVPPRAGQDFRVGFTPLAAQARAAGRGPRVDGDDPRVAEALARRGFDLGRERHPHSLCPVDPSQYSGRDPVVLLDGGVWCYRCDGRTGDGFRSWAAIVGDGGPVAEHPWVPAAREWVHWVHARATLPMLGLRPDQAEVAYSGLLRAMHRRMREEDAPRFEELRAQVFNPHLRFLRGDSGRWLHADQLEPIDLKDQELACLPWVRGRRELVALARSGAPIDGYVPVRPVDTVLNPESVPPGVALVTAPRSSPAPAPLDPRVEPMPLAEAEALLLADFPGLDLAYLRLLVAACACSEAGGSPVILAAVGDSGAGKTQTIYLACSILEARCADVTDAFSPPSTEESWRRRVGEALSGGHRPLVVNDLHRVRGLHQQVKLLISLEDPLAYRSLFSSAARARLRAPIILTCVTAPRALALPEVARRIHVHRLPGRVSDWREREVSPARWRSTPTPDEAISEAEPATWARVRAGEAFLAAARGAAAEGGFRWAPVARALGAVTGEDADPEQDEVDRTLLGRLFEHCCGRDGKRIMSRAARWPGSRGWVDLTSPSAQEVLAELLPDLGPSHDPRHALTQQLMETDWRRALGREGSLRFSGNVRGTTWVGRFEASGMRGQAPVNEGIEVRERL